MKPSALAFSILIALSSLAVPGSYWHWGGTFAVPPVLFGAPHGDEPEGDDDASPSPSGDVYSLSGSGDSDDEEASTAHASGGLIAYGLKAGGQWDIYTTDVESAASSQLTSEPGDEWAAAWSPDGARIAYISDQTGTPQAWVMGRDGSGQRQVTGWSGQGEVSYVAWLPGGDDLIVTLADQSVGVAWMIRQPLDGGSPTSYTDPWTSFPSFSDDGAMAYVVRSNGETDVMLLDGSTQAIAATTLNEDAPNITRDGTRLIYQVGDPGGRYVEIYDLSTGIVTALRQIGDASNPVWSPDGERIAFVSEDGPQAGIYLAGTDGGAIRFLPIPDHETVWYLSWSI